MTPGELLELVHRLELAVLEVGLEIGRVEAGARRDLDKFTKTSCELEEARQAVRAAILARTTVIQ